MRAGSSASSENLSQLASHDFAISQSTVTAPDPINGVITMQSAIYPYAHILATPADPLNIQYVSSSAERPKSAHSDRHGNSYVTFPSEANKWNHAVQYIVM